VHSELFFHRDFFLSFRSFSPRPGAGLSFFLPLPWTFCPLVTLFPVCYLVWWMFKREALDVSRRLSSFSLAFECTIPLSRLFYSPSLCVSLKQRGYWRRPDDSLFVFCFFFCFFCWFFGFFFFFFFFFLFFFFFFQLAEVVPSLLNMGLLF